MRYSIGAVSLVIILFILNGASVGADLYGKEGLSISTGLEYQVISQSYYNAILDTSTVDPIENWALAHDNIDDILSRTSISYRSPGRPGLFKINGDVNFSENRWIGRGEGTLNLGTVDNGVTMFGNLEYKAPFDNAPEDELGYMRIFSYLKGNKQLNDKLSVSGRVSLENNDFADNNIKNLDTNILTFSAYRDYNYSIIGGRFSGEYRIDELGKSLTWQVGANHRTVPDSAYAEYNQVQFDCGYGGFGMSGYIMAAANVEIKDYAQPDNQDDYTAIDVNARIGRTISEIFEITIFGQSQYFAYRESDIINHDNLRLRLDLEAARLIKAWGVGPKIRLQSYSEQSSAAVTDEFDVDFSEDYYQWELGAHANYFGGETLLLDAESTLGHRRYTEGGEVITSYDLISVSLMSSLLLGGRTSVSLFFDGDFEFHEAQENNSNLYLFSISVTTRLY